MLKRLVVAFLPAIIFAAAWVALPVVAGSNTTLCAFRIITGKPCVFCGLTRAFAYAAHGDFATASRFHPLWWVFALLIVVISGLAWIDILKKTTRLERLWAGVPVLFTAILLLSLSIVRWFIGV